MRLRVLLAALLVVYHAKQLDAFSFFTSSQKDLSKDGASDEDFHASTFCIPGGQQGQIPIFHPLLGAGNWDSLRIARATPVLFLDFSMLTTIYELLFDEKPWTHNRCRRPSRREPPC
jgi:hypothetical protein